MVELLTAASILVALFTWLVNHRRAVRSERIQLTGQLIGNFSTNAILDRANLTFGRVVLSGRPLKDDKISEDLDQEIIRVLDYYEFLCKFCELGVLDRETIVGLRGKPIVQAWEFAEGYILARRRRLSYPGLYQCLEKLAREIREQSI